MSDEDLQNEVVETVEEPVQEAVRPDYVPEEYWNNGQVDVQKMTKDLATDKKRIDDLRRIISQPKKPEPYDKLFDDRELNEWEKDDMTYYVDLAKKHNLSKKQAEALYDDVIAARQEKWQRKAEAFIENTKKELGNEFKPIIDGLNAFSTNQVKSGKWTEEDQQAFNNMGMDAKSLRILSQLIANQPKLNLSGTASTAPSEDALTKELYDLSASYHKMVKMGRGDEPAVQEMKTRLNKLQNEYSQMIDNQGVTNDLF